MEEISISPHVSYSQFYIIDEILGDLPTLPLRDANSAGIVQALPGFSILYTGIEYGAITLTFAADESDPGVDYSSWVDIVEVSFLSLSGKLLLNEWGGGNTYDLPTLSAGSAVYRMRYCARYGGGDSGSLSDTFLVQLWPQAPGLSSAVKVESLQAAALLKAHPLATSEKATMMRVAAIDRRSDEGAVAPSSRWDEPRLGPTAHVLSVDGSRFERLFRGQDPKADSSDR
jgi:hypothetical protein